MEQKNRAHKVHSVAHRLNLHAQMLEIKRGCTEEHMYQSIKSFTLISRVWWIDSCVMQSQNLVGRWFMSAVSLFHNEIGCPHTITHTYRAAVSKKCSEVYIHMCMQFIRQAQVRHGESCSRSLQEGRIQLDPNTYKDGWLRCGIEAILGPLHICSSKISSFP